jgi:hypothetical protein
MARSIIQSEKECYVCGTTYDLQEHHIFFGTANRRLSEKHGLKVWLCQHHHTGQAGVHFNKDLDTQLKKLAQERFEAEYGQNISFRDVFGRNYL